MHRQAIRPATAQGLFAAPLPCRELPAVLVEGHRRGGRRIVGIGQARRRESRSCRPGAGGPHPRSPAARCQSPARPCAGTGTRRSTWSCLPAPAQRPDKPSCFNRLITGGSVRWISISIESPVSREISGRMRALPQQIMRGMPQQAAARTIRERLTLLRIGGHARSNSRGRCKVTGGWWRCWTKSDIGIAKNWGQGTMTGVRIRRSRALAPVWRTDKRYGTCAHARIRAQTPQSSRPDTGRITR